MRIKIKKLSTQLGLVLIATVLFAGLVKISDWQSENLEAHLLPGDPGSADSNVVWGQAYSPNVGWINFYCDGSNSTRPTTTTSGGASAMSDSCGSVAYGVTYDTSAGKFSGIAYSTNYGWLDMKDLSMTAPTPTQTAAAAVSGTTTGGWIVDYHFRETYFGENQPNAFSPGVRYYPDEDTGLYFCGFAYSKAIGYISFCDPQTKAGTSAVSGYDWNTYAVYMGFSDVTPPTPNPPDPKNPDPSFPPDPPAAKILGADHEYSYTMFFVDGGAPGEKSGIASIEIKVMDSNGTEKTYSSSNSESVLISNHDFHEVGYYELTSHACDYAGNCGDYANANFFRVVANVPDWSATTSGFLPSVDTKISDGVEKHTVRAELLDKYGNPVISVGGIKTVDIASGDFKFTDTTRLDQIGMTGSDGDATVFSSVSVSGAEGNEYSINVGSFTPTSAGYPIIGSGFNLNFTALDYEITALGGYTNVGETDNTASVAPAVVFKFAPTLTSVPESKNVTVANAPSYFDIGFENHSATQSASNPELGLLFALEAGKEMIVWKDAETDDPSIANISLVIDTTSPFGSTLNAISTFIGSVANGATKTLPILAVPELTVDVIFDEFDTTVGTYLGYTVNGKNVTHKSDLINDEGLVYSAYIDIIGIARSDSGITSNRIDGDLNRSLGDFTRTELKSQINRTTTSIRNEGGCSGDKTITNLDTFISDNPNCVYKDGGVIYLESTLESTITLNLSGNLPAEPTTLFIEGGNLQIESDLNYPASANSASFGVIVLKNGTKGGDVLVHPDVRNISAMIYAEGSLIATDDSWNYEVADRYLELRNQLYWQGIIATANTIGGADRSPLDCPDGVNCGSDREEARIYDLNYFRTFHKDLVDADSYRASGVSTNDAALIVKYDSRIQSNPPPLFEFATGSSSGEIGY